MCAGAHPARRENRGARLLGEESSPKISCAFHFSSPFSVTEQHAQLDLIVSSFLVDEETVSSRQPSLLCASTDGKACCSPDRASPTWHGLFKTLMILRKISDGNFATITARTWALVTGNQGEGGRS